MQSNDMTSYHVLARLPAAVREMSPRSAGESGGNRD